MGFFKKNAHCFQQVRYLETKKTLYSNYLIIRCL